MEEFKSMDYLQQLVNDYGKGEAMTIIETIGYLLMDNGYENARFFLDDLNELVEDEL